MDNRYRVIYDVGLLDDLHNYFPGLLYEPDRFRTVSDVLAYIQENTSRRFNLYDQGRQSYVSDYRRVPENTFTQIGHTPVVNMWTPPRSRVTRTNSMPMASSMASPSPIPSILRAPTMNNNIADIQVEVTDMIDLLTILRGLGTTVPPPSTTTTGLTRRTNTLQGRFQDVIVHSSAEQLENASSVRTLLLDLEESCSICQDRMRQGENIRRLNACQHEFHTGCVDNWFLRSSVICPVCRHDIRDPTEVRRSPILTGQVAPLQAQPLPQLQAQPQAQLQAQLQAQPQGQLQAQSAIHPPSNLRQRRLD